MTVYQHNWCINGGYGGLVDLSHAEELRGHRAPDPDRGCPEPGRVPLPGLRVRLKRSHGEILAVKQVFEPEPTRVKSYGVWLTFRSVRGTHNIYKEFRDTTTEGAILRLYQEMAGTHNVQPKAISIIKIAEVKPEDIRHKHVEQFAEEHIKFPQQPIRPAHASQKKLLSRKRPTICGF